MEVKGEAGEERVQRPAVSKATCVLSSWGCSQSWEVISLGRRPCVLGPLPSTLLSWPLGGHPCVLLVTARLSLTVTAHSKGTEGKRPPFNAACLVPRSRDWGWIQAPQPPFPGCLATCHGEGGHGGHSWHPGAPCLGLRAKDNSLQAFIFPKLTA